MRAFLLSSALVASMAAVPAYGSAQTRAAHATAAATASIPAPADATEWAALLDAENSRAASPAQVQALLGAARKAPIAVRRISVRALGRLQRANLTDSIVPWLRDPSPAMRSEAARAIALASIADRSPNNARTAVRQALDSERDPVVLAALAETLGRLRLASADSARTVAARLATLDSSAMHNPTVMLGVARGLHFILRQSAAVRPGLVAARADLIRIAESSTDHSANATHARRIATETLALAGFGDENTATTILSDPDAFVRRGAVMFAGPPARDTAVAHRIINRGFRDPAWNVRFEALKQLGARFGAATSCDDVAAHLRDSSMHVRLATIDLLASACAPTTRTAMTLDSIARTLPAAANSATAEWHPAAHAVVALAIRSPSQAAALIDRFVSSDNFFVRTYAANAAAEMKDTVVLLALAKDAHPNVRTAAVHGLRAAMHHGADPVYLSELSNDDSQLLIEAAGALDSTSYPGAATALFDALDRVTAQERENSRDGRMALLNTIAHVGAPANATRLSSYLNDYDPQVATRAAAILKAWTGVEQTTSPALLPAEPLPTYAEVAALQNTRVTVEMASGATFTIQPLAFDAPVNASRFVRLARNGYFNGVALHRIEPNFVVQGGSPNANEFTGAPRFSRDELGYPNDRGTIGLSTRGHDTGDAQLYINTVDNVQLDPFYTVFAEVVSGMDQVDAILEGAVIRRVVVNIGTHGSH